MNVTNVEAFKLELCQRVEALPRVNRLEFIGLVANADCVVSSSDLRVFVHRHNVTRQGEEGHGVGEGAGCKVWIWL